MIDWLGVAANGLWVLGLAGMLATLSYFNNYARLRGQSTRQVLKAPMFTRPFAWAAAVFCMGVAASASSWWQRAGWVALAVLLGVQAWRASAPADAGKIQ